MEKSLEVKHKIVLVPFPFDDLSSNKLRPAICLTNQIGEFNHIVVAFVTSKISKDLNKSDLVIKSGIEGFERTGLKVSSTIKLHKIVTNYQTRIR